jgi:putative copper resistance protein D
LLALGAPVTLALAATGPAGRRRIARVLHSAPLSVVGHPAFAWVLFVASPFVLYFTGLYELSLRNGLVHSLVHAHFLVTGAWFFWPLIGVDPVPHRQSPGLRMLYAVLTLPFHAFLGIAIMGSSRVLAEDYYASLGFASERTPLAEQNLGGGLLWAAGDVVGLVLVAVLLRQWMQQEAHAERREDARIDALDQVAEKSTGD